METLNFSILLVLIGLFVGSLILFIKALDSSKKVDIMLEKARKDSEKIKRDYLLEAK
ncbi:MAG TPA: hypothetical protein GX747_05025, partial [Tenericutes bacterium]|nr:hypothetical protein [Mycoplasmatota bacterium]